MGEADCAENAVEVPDRLEHIWSMLQRDWITDCLLNLSRTEMVLTTSSKEWGSALMMAMTASSVVARGLITGMMQCPCFASWACETVR